MKYTVEVLEVHRTLCEIESDTRMTRQQLLDKANEMIEEGEQSDYLEYDRTLDPESWITRNKNGDFVC